MEDLKMLDLYHGEPAANSLKTLIAFKEKGVEFNSHFINLHEFEQHEPWYLSRTTSTAP